MNVSAKTLEDRSKHLCSLPTSSWMMSELQAQKFAALETHFLFLTTWNTFHPIVRDDCLKVFRHSELGWTALTKRRTDVLSSLRTGVVVTLLKVLVLRRQRCSSKESQGMIGGAARGLKGIVRTASMWWRCCRLGRLLGKNLGEGSKLRQHTNVENCCCCC